MEGSPVVVLIHGGQVGSWVWDSVRSQLKGPSVAVNLPGHDGSGGSLKGLRVSQCVDAVLREIPSSGRIILVGHSLGGAVALAVASRISDRIARLVLIAAMVPKPGEPMISSFPFGMRLMSNIVLRLIPEFAELPAVIKNKNLNGMSPAAADLVAAKFSKESSSLMLDRVDWKLDSRVPVTYVRCMRDRGALSPTYQEQLAARLPGANVIAIDACHYAMIEKPTEVAAVLNSAQEVAEWTS
jgi:pimeloyl-ACP methyl ester carboxylesterase